MYRASRVSFDNAISPAAQITVNDAGLGTDNGATALTAPLRFVQKLLSSIDGRGHHHKHRRLLHFHPEPL